MTADLLGGGKNSRLYKRLVYTDRTATNVTACVGPFELGSQVQIVVTVKPGSDPAVVEKALDEELARFLATGPTPEEVERIRTTNFASFARGAERIDGFGGKSSILAESQVYGGSPDFYKTRLGWVANATPADVQGAAKRWLSDGVFVLNVEPVPAFKTVASTVDRSKLPATGAPPSLKLPAPSRAQAVERTGDRGGRAAQRTRGRLHADGGCRFRGRRAGEARHGAPRDADGAGRHEDADLAANCRSCGIARRADRRGFVARSFVPQHERAQQPAR